MAAVHPNRFRCDEAPWKHRQAVFLPLQHVDRRCLVKAPKRAAQTQAIEEESGAAHARMRQPDDAHAEIVLVGLPNDRIHANCRDLRSAGRQRTPQRPGERPDASMRAGRILAAEKTDMHAVTVKVAASRQSPLLSMGVPPC